MVYANSVSVTLRKLWFTPTPSALLYVSVLVYAISVSVSLRQLGVSPTPSALLSVRYGLRQLPAVLATVMASLSATCMINAHPVSVAKVPLSKAPYVISPPDTHRLDDYMYVKLPQACTYLFRHLCSSTACMCTL